MEDGIHIQRHKTAGSTGKRTIYEWTPELGQQWKWQNRHVQRYHLTYSATGKGKVISMRELAYGTAGIACRDASRTVLKETKVTERFTEHDLRAKCAADGESLACTSPSFACGCQTNRSDLPRKPERIRSLKWDSIVHFDSIVQKENAVPLRTA